MWNLSNSFVAKDTHKETIEWLRAFRALVQTVSPLSCGHVQQGVSLEGSAGAILQTLPSKGQWRARGENMKPYEGKHETPEA